jgi:hypothetical protein
MTYQEPVYRFRVYRIWSWTSSPDVAGQKTLVYSARDIYNAEEQRLWMSEFYGDLGDKFVVEDHGHDIVIKREEY